MLKTAINVSTVDKSRHKYSTTLAIGVGNNMKFNTKYVASTPAQAEGEVYGLVFGGGDWSLRGKKKRGGEDETERKGMGVKSVSPLFV